MIKAIDMEMEIVLNKIFKKIGNMGKTDEQKEFIETVFNYDLLDLEVHEISDIGALVIPSCGFRVTDWEKYGVRDLHELYYDPEFCEPGASNDKLAEIAIKAADGRGGLVIYAQKEVAHAMKQQGGWRSEYFETATHKDDPTVPNRYLNTYDILSQMIEHGLESTDGPIYVLGQDFHDQRAKVLLENMLDGRDVFIAKREKIGYDSESELLWTTDKQKYYRANIASIANSLKKQNIRLLDGKHFSYTTENDEFAQEVIDLILTENDMKKSDLTELEKRGLKGELERYKCRVDYVDDTELQVDHPIRSRSTCEGRDIFLTWQIDYIIDHLNSGEMVRDIVKKVWVRHSALTEINIAYMTKEGLKKVQLYRGDAPVGNLEWNINSEIEMSWDKTLTQY